MFLQFQFLLLLVGKQEGHVASNKFSPNSPQYVTAVVHSYCICAIVPVVAGILHITLSLQVVGFKSTLCCGT